MNVDIFTRQVETVNSRLHQLFRDAGISSSQSQMLAQALKELGVISEELQVAVDELMIQNEELASTRLKIEAERQRYENLFDFTPDAQLVTDVGGTIQEANRAACNFFNVPQRFLLGKPLIVFVVESDRLKFRSELNKLQNQDRIQEIEVSIQPRHGEIFEVAFRLAPLFDCQGNLIELRWLLRDISQEKRSHNNVLGNDCDFNLERRSFAYNRGEIIPLSKDIIWLVSEGLVKLTTITENGEEVLIGFAGKEMVFGSTLTSLQTYQATALSSRVELVSICLSDITIYPNLSQSLFPKISQRLKQTEAMLAISGQKLVKDRLRNLLRLLQQEFGEPVAEGTRLSVRLIHEDLASACCTTRVTVTRLLSMLQQQGEITFDSKSHIIIKHPKF
ncbi:PAS domain S-box protein [Phormidium sp. LEGE 05292]|uniref:PAS domain S-box protein n=1 Tax=[Phormidium] sp. LEGE 05292 TaxID=767427 RepID=UPI001880D486|nr:PAS domain S-box protein [Phormidium sp. LEGE 05292]MBE9224796.1 PAS domain S-box protein [Phormidium sp. LEGE 05292]